MMYKEIKEFTDEIILFLGEIHKIYICDMFNVMEKKVIYKCDGGYLVQYVKHLKNKHVCSVRIMKNANIEMECPRTYKLRDGVYFDSLNINESSSTIILSEGSVYEIEIERDSLLDEKSILSSCLWVSINSNQKKKGLSSFVKKGEIIMLISKSDLTKSLTFKEHPDFLDDEINKGQIKSPLREYLYTQVRNNNAKYISKNNSNLKSIKKDIFNVSIGLLKNRFIDFEFVVSKIIE